VPTSQRSKGADDLYGLGRLKLRHIGLMGGVWKSTRSGVTFTSSVPYHKFLAFGGPTPQGTEVIKCVMLQHEDMSHKDSISNIDLKVELLHPTSSGGCSERGDLGALRIDDGTDTKSMVAFDADDGLVGNRCAYVTIDKKALASEGLATTTYCYASGTQDDAPW
jgi:hypothetical protein